MDDKYAVGNRLASIRESKKISQEVLAEKLGCSAVTVSRWENGKSRMKDENIFSICKVLKISSDVLLGIDCNEISECLMTESLMSGLSESQRLVICETVKTMAGAMIKYAS